MKTAIFHNSKHLTDSELIDNRESCPICLSKQIRKNIFQNQKGPDIFFLECPNCHGYSASYMPTEFVLNDYYNNYYLPDKNENTNNISQNAITFHGANRLSKHIANHIDIHDFNNHKIIKIMDFGGGDGSISYQLAKELEQKLPSCTFQIKVIDYYEKCHYTDGAISLEFAKQIESNDEKYDIIIASAILEHIPELNKTIHLLINKANENCYFYARTPYMIPLSKIKIPIDISYPGHVHDLGSKFWYNFTKTFNLNWSIVFSQTSIVETDFKHQFIRTLLAYILKAPSRLELFFNKKKEDKIWKFVGSWEILFKVND